jgi:inhibitor of KinA sporulation pathway (predicted exonuclease)
MCVCENRWNVRLKCGTRFGDCSQEIIEFPIVVVDAQTKKIVEEFHHFVKPEVHPTLSAFCTRKSNVLDSFVVPVQFKTAFVRHLFFLLNLELTGITQAQVNGGKPLVEVLRLAEEFVAKYTAKGNCTMVTCGHWDLDKMLRSQTKLLKIDTKTVSL